MNNEKPKKCCYPDCLNCHYDDCYYDIVEYKDILEQNRFDKELEAIDPEVLLRRKIQRKYQKSEKGKIVQERYRKSQKGKLSQKRYLASEKGKLTRERYRKSEKGKETKKKYEQSEKGKEKNKRRTKKKIESGKNAEYCRKYYWKKKAEKERLKLLEA